MIQEAQKTRLHLLINMKMKQRFVCFSARPFAATLLVAAISTAVSAADYQSTVLSDSPLAYYRLGEIPVADVATNKRTLGATGNGTHGPGVVHRVSGALVGNANAAASYGVGGTTHTFVPFRSALNPPSGSPFTIEYWAKPAVEVTDAPGPCPLFNRVTPGNRSGWVFFQRSPTTGWNCRFYNGSGDSVGISLTGGTNAQGTWSHIVVVWTGSVATMYVNGALVAGPTAGVYNASTSAIFSVGSYDDGVSNPFNGAVDEVAFYSSALSGAQILAHYQNGSNAAPATLYSSLIATDGAIEYLRLDEANPKVDAALNYGSLGATADAIHTPGVRHPVSGPLVGNASETAATYTGVVPSDGGQPTYVPATQALRIRELWDNVGVGSIGGMGSGTTSVGVDSGNNWSLNAGNITVAQDFDVEGPQGPPYALGHQGGVWKSGGADWNTGYWATRQLASAAQINFAAAGDYWLTVRINNSGDSAVGVGLASAGDGSASFVGVGAMWDNAGGGLANNALYVTDGSLGTDSPYTIRANSTAGTIDGEGVIVAHLLITGGSYTLEAAVFKPGDVIPSTPGGITWQVTYSGSSSMLATHLLLWSNGAGTGDLDAIRVADSFASMFTDSLKPLNPAGSLTIEAWVKPAINGVGNAQCPLHNRAATRGDGNGDLSGWDFYQRDSSVGWNFEMFNGVGGNNVFNITGGPYTVGAWQHLVAVYDASVPSATLYLNGVQVAQSTTPNGTFVAKTFGDFAIGSYSQPWMNPQGYENAFVGSIGQVAIYSNVLSLARISAHYLNAINPSPATPYSTLVLSDAPVGYWRLNEGPHNVSTNLGTLTTAADGVYANTLDGVVGPQAPAYAGFETTNKAKTFDGSSSYIELLNPSGLDFSGPITLEAWVQPGAVQGFLANILAHGVNGAGNAEVMMRLTDANTYAVASWDGANHGASSAIPGADLAGTAWIHLVGTYDGANWNFYRNGVLAATVADATGAIQVNAAWAIGSRGRWIQAFGYGAGASYPDRQFTGGIDEPAIYNTALNAARIQAHWFVGKYGTTTPPLPTLTITRSGSDVLVTWSAGVLLEATSVTGPYTEVAGATSPYTVPASAAGKFYRARL